MTELEIIQKAFPVEIREEINSLLTKFSVETKHSTLGFESIAIGQEKFEIPQRIYYNPPYSLVNSKFTQKEQEILNCIFSRHHNGYIRQKASSTEYRLEKGVQPDSTMDKAVRI
jgi:hypothetical protein